MSFISVLKTIGNDIEKGIKIAEPVIGTFVPGAGPILLEIATIIVDLEGGSSTLSSDQLSQIIQTLSAASTIKQSVASKGPTGTGGTS